MFSNKIYLFYSQFVFFLSVGRLLRPDIVHFHLTCLGTEIFLWELTLSSTLSSNPKSSRFIDLQFFYKLFISSSQIL